MNTSTKYEALNQREQLFWDAALAALYSNPHLKGRTTLDLTVVPLPETNTLCARVTIRNRGRKWSGSLAFGADQIDLAYEPREMMFRFFARSFAGAAQGLSKEATK